MTDKIEHLLKLIETQLATEQQPLIDQLRFEIASLCSVQQDEQTQSINMPFLDEKTGCYQVGNQTARYCPQCYEQSQQLITSQRVNSKLRVCPKCRASIKAPVKSK
jgi:hypothetical protein